MLLRTRFFNGPELDTGPSIASLGLYLGGIGAGLFFSSSFLGMLPSGITQIIAGWGCLFGFSFMMTGFALSVVGLAISGFASINDELFNSSENNHHSYQSMSMA